MLCRSRQFGERFSNFLTGAAGDTGEAAFRWVYGKSLDRIEIDFKRHVSQKEFPGSDFEIVLNRLPRNRESNRPPIQKSAWSRLTCWWG